MTLKTSLAAMTHDANTWSDTATMLDGCVKSAQGLHLSPQTFTFLGSDAHSSYEDVLNWMTGYLTKGADQTAKAGKQLAHVRDVFAGTDEAAKQRLQSQWQWH